MPGLYKETSFIPEASLPSVLADTTDRRGFREIDLDHLGRAG